MAKDGIPLGDFSGSNATDELRETIKRFHDASSKQARTMIVLTWAMTALTVVMAIGLAVQIWLTFYPPLPRP